MSCGFGAEEAQTYYKSYRSCLDLTPVAALVQI